MAYQVLDIARYMIDSAERNGTPLSNLKLQKILYFEWKDYYRANNCSLFEAAFHAWQFGPVVPKVYYEYFMFGAYPISRNLLESFDDSVIKSEDKSFIDTIIRTYAKKSVFQLVEETHKPGSAWDRTFKDGLGNREVIPFKDIEEDVDNGR